MYSSGRLNGEFSKCSLRQARSGSRNPSDWMVWMAMEGICWTEECLAWWIHQKESKRQAYHIKASVPTST